MKADLQTDAEEVTVRGPIAWRRWLPLLLSAVSLFAFLLFVPVDEDNFVVSVVPLLLLWMVMYYSLGLLLERVLKRRTGLVRMARIAVASLSVLVMMFNALGQLSVVDVIALVSLVALGSFYFSRTWHGRE